MYIILINYIFINSHYYVKDKSSLCDMITKHCIYNETYSLITKHTHLCRKNYIIITLLLEWFSFQNDFCFL